MDVVGGGVGVSLLGTFLRRPSVTSCGQCDATNRIRYAHEVFNAFATAAITPDVDTDADVDVSPDEVEATPNN